MRPFDASSLLGTNTLFFSSPCSLTPSVYDLFIKQEIKFHAHRKQHVKLYFTIAWSLYFSEKRRENNDLGLNYSEKFPNSVFFRFLPVCSSDFVMRVRFPAWRQAVINQRLLKEDTAVTQELIDPFLYTVKSSMAEVKWSRSCQESDIP
jgi:hypothetical protein